MSSGNPVALRLFCFISHFLGGVSVFLCSFCVFLKVQPHHGSDAKGAGEGYTLPNLFCQKAALWLVQGVRWSWY